MTFMSPSIHAMDEPEQVLEDTDIRPTTSGPLAARLAKHRAVSGRSRALDDDQASLVAHSARVYSLVDKSL
jgi:hypothetical protein